MSRFVTFVMQAPNRGLTGRRSELQSYIDFIIFHLGPRLKMFQVQPFNILQPAAQWSSKSTSSFHNTMADGPLSSLSSPLPCASTAKRTLRAVYTGFSRAAAACWFQLGWSSHSGASFQRPGRPGVRGDTWGKWGSGTILLDVCCHSDTTVPRY